MGAHEAQAYLDPGTPEEQSRRTFLANATLAIGGVVSLVLAVPLVTSLIPESLIKPGLGKGTWTPLSEQEWRALQNSTNKPVKVDFSFRAQDGYLTTTEEQFVWGVKLTPEQEQTFKQKRPDLFGKPDAEVPYPAVNMSFVIFSSVCPHLGCRYNWSADAKRFICPCHGSQFGIQGDHLAGPAPRGLDPLPLREANGTAEITWIMFKTQQPARLIVSYS